MPITVNWPEEGLVVVGFSGRLDLAGAQEIDQRLTGTTATQKLRVVFDLTALTFISSIGIRSLLSAAKAQALRGGRTVMFGAQPNVKQVLITSGVDRLIPMFDDGEGARASVGASGQ